MAKKEVSIKSILDCERDKYYKERKEIQRSSTDPEKSNVLKDGRSSTKDRESSTLESVREGDVEKPASPISVGSPSKRVLKKGKIIPRKKDVSMVASSQGEVIAGESDVLKQAEVVVETSQVGNVEVLPEKVLPAKRVTKIAMEEGEEETLVDFFSLNISEEVASAEAATSHQDDATSESQRIKRQSSRSPSQSSGEGPLKKRKIIVDPPIMENVMADITMEMTILPVVIGENLNLNLQVNDDENQGCLIPSLSPNQEIILGDEYVTPVDNLRVALPIIDHVLNLDANQSQEPPAEMNESVALEKVKQGGSSKTGNASEEEVLLVDKMDILNKRATSEQAMGADSKPLSQQPVMDLVTNIIGTIVVDQVAVTGSRAISYNEFMALKAKILETRKAMMKRLDEIEAKISAVDRPDLFVGGAIYMLQKMIRKGIIPLDTAMDPALWNSP